MDFDGIKKLICNYLSLDLSTAAHYLYSIPVVAEAEYSKKWGGCK